MADFIPYQHAVARDVSASGSVVLSPERWALLVRHFEALGPGKFDALQLQTLTIAKPIEVGGVTFLPAVYRAA